MCGNLEFAPDENEAMQRVIDEVMPANRPPCKHRWWSGDDANPFCLDCGEDKEVVELRADYAKAIELLAETGLLLVIVGVHKQKIFAPWQRAQTAVLRKPRAQAILAKLRPKWLNDEIEQAPHA